MADPDAAGRAALGVAALTPDQPIIAEVPQNALKPEYIIAINKLIRINNRTKAPRVTAIASDATPTINTDTVDQFHITALAVAITSMTTNLGGTPDDGQTLIIRIKDNGTTRAITWGSKFVSTGTGTLLANTSANKTHLVRLLYDANVGKWACIGSDATGY